jgi:hypothetical protein
MEETQPEPADDSNKNVHVITLPPPENITAHIHVSESDVNAYNSNVRNRRGNLQRNTTDQGYVVNNLSGLMPLGETENTQRYIDRVSQWALQLTREQLVVIVSAMLLVLFMATMLTYHMYESSSTLTILFVDDYTPLRSLPPSDLPMIDVDSHRYISAKVDSRRADSHLVKIMENNHAMMKRSGAECIYPNMYDTEWNVLTLRDSRISYINTRFLPIGVADRIVKVFSGSNNKEHRIVKIYDAFNISFDAAFRSAGDRVYVPIFYADFANQISFDSRKGAGQEAVAVCIQTFFIFGRDHTNL